MRSFLLMVVVFTLSGCVASVEDLAEEGNWYQIGYQDGVAGHRQRSQRDLAELGKPRVHDYDEGYLVGIDEFCNPNFAYQIGVSGQYYEGVCENTPDGQRFRMEWQRGWDEYKNQ